MENLSPPILHAFSDMRSVFFCCHPISFCRICCLIERLVVLYLLGTGRNLTALLTQRPQAVAIIKGSDVYPQIRGTIRFYQTRCGVLVAAELCGLPASAQTCERAVFGFHIHSGNHCSGNGREVFSEAMAHYNPDTCPHPSHAGDLPPLFGNDGYAWSAFLTNRFSVKEIIGRSLIVHAQPDDFTTQPSGNAGEKIACGQITAE